MMVMDKIKSPYEGISALYRFDYRISGTDKVTIFYTTYDIEDVTPQGVWVYDPNQDRKRFVLLTARRRFAHPTLDEAMEEYVKELSKQLAYLAQEITGVKKAITLAEQWKGEECLQEGILPFWRTQ